MFVVTCVIITTIILTGAGLGHDVAGADTEYDFPDYSTHHCVRHCADTARPQICKYHFLLEEYYSMSRACNDCPLNQSDCFLPHCVTAAGILRPIKTINRQLPGPSIQVCEGDVVEVTVENRMMMSEGTTIHWHGILQHGSQHMDGVSHVTQCPINSHTKFTYRFKAENPGTHFYHSHSGMQRADGLFGSLVIRRQDGLEPQIDLYDFDLPDHVIIVNDFLSQVTIENYAGYYHSVIDNKPDLILVNGMGQYQEFKDAYNKSVYTPTAIFTVSPGKRYRFRVISATFLNCQIRVSVDGHDITMISSDGNPFEPFLADAFNIFAGERYDFILHANNTRVLRNYWIRFQGLQFCGERFLSQTAILKYEGAPDELPPEGTTYDDSVRSGIDLNPALTSDTESPGKVSNMVSMEPDDDVLTSTPDKKFYLAFDFNQIDVVPFNNPKYYPTFARSSQIRNLYGTQVNHISFKIPASPPLSQFADVPETDYCTEDTIPERCLTEYCTCIHRIQLKLGDLVEVVFVAEGVTGNAFHPFHLHGHKFRVLGMDSINISVSIDEIKAMDKRGKLIRATTWVPIKDTVIVPDGGYTIVRFRADNPGMWLLHCHLEYHMENGMALIFQVGDYSQFPVPPKNFPTCGNWGPEDELSDYTNITGTLGHWDNGTLG